MTTQAQITANRLNAQSSTGPRSRQGKAIVSQNAVKHGLSARTNVISSENQADFDRHRQQLLDDLAPVTPMESILAERIVSLSWRLKRTLSIQNQTIDALEYNFTSRRPIRFQFLQKNDPPPPPESLDLARTLIRDFSNERVLDRLLMYERRTEHSLYRTMLELQRLRLIRNMHNLESENDKLPD
jgi:hypothetical protein